MRFPTIFLTGITVLALLSALNAQATPMYDSSYSSIQARDCKMIALYDEEGSGGSVQDCPPFNGIGVRVIEGDLRQSISLIHNGQEQALNFWSFNTGFSKLGKVIEWRHLKGNRRAIKGMIARYQVTHEPLDNAAQQTSWLFVSKVKPQQSCVVAKVPPSRDGSQNGQARAIAEKADTMDCLIPASGP